MTALFKQLTGQTLQDIVLCGVVDLDCDPADFIPLLDRVYLEIGDRLVEIRRDDRTLRINVGYVESVHLECELENTQRLCRSSIGRYALTDPLADNRLVKIIAYLDESESIQAFEIGLQSGQMIFFDPAFVDGINFGGSEQKATWLANSHVYRVISVE